MPRGLALLRVLLALAAAAGACWLAPAAAQGDAAALERRVKAAFLFKFTSYVEWPPSAFAAPDSAVTIGVMGDDPLAAELSQMVSGRTVDARPIAVRRVGPTDSAQGLHILFVGRAESARLVPSARSPALSLLVVSDSPDGLRPGAAINFVVTDGRVRFDVALDAAERHGIRLSSRLLAVARNVRSAP